MAHARHTIELAEKVGVSPATIERDRASGMWPADPTAEIKRHYEVMRECGKVVGRAKDRTWAIALDAAERFGWPIERLRTVLTEPPVHLVAPTFHDRIRTVLVHMAQGVEGLVAYPEPSTRPTADPAEAVVDDAYRAIGKLVVGEAVEPEDFTDLGEIVQTVGEQAMLDGVPSNGDPGDDDRPFADDVQDLLAANIERMIPGDRPWASDASPDRLVLAVAAAAKVVDLCDALSPAAASTGDIRRAEIATFVSRFGPTLDVIAEVTGGQFTGTEIMPTLGKLPPLPQNRLEPPPTAT